MHVNHWGLNRLSGLGMVVEILCFFFKFFIEVQLIYNVALISAVQQSDSVIHIYIYSCFKVFSSIMVYHRILNIVPCAIQ